MLDDNVSDNIPLSHHEQPEPEAAILDAYKDQNGRRWIRYGTPDQSILFMVGELVTRGRDVYERLETAGIPLITARSKAAFELKIEQHRDFRAGLVASGPGWIDNDHFVFGDGNYEHRYQHSEPLIGFGTDARFNASSSVEAYQNAVGPFVIDQPLVATMLAYSLVGPLLRFAPSDVGNPIVELCGKPHRGKSSLAVAVSSSWSDDKSSKIGMMQSFNATTNGLEQHIRRFNDMLLGVDEENLADERPGRTELSDLIFRIESGRLRQRSNEREAANYRVAALITANRPIAEAISQREKREAALSRVLTLPVGESIFSGDVEGYSTAYDATRALFSAFRLHAGIAGPAMIRAILHYSPAELTEKFSKRAASFTAHKISLPPRKLNTMVLISLAASIAEAQNLFPSEWNVGKSIVKIARSLAPDCGPTVSVLDRVKSFLSDYELIPPCRFQAPPMSPVDFANSACCYRDTNGEWRAYIGTTLFRREFPDFLNVMKTLRSKGLAKTEGGIQTKLTVKAPTVLCTGARAYCLYIEQIIALNTD